MGRRAWFHGWWRVIEAERPEDEAFEAEEFIEVEQAQRPSIFNIEGVREAFTGVSV